MKKNIFFTFITLMSFYIHAQEWTWMKGSDTLTQPGFYGTLGVSSPSNNPGSRHGAATWVDNAGNLWLFGGEGLSTNTVLCWLSDMWKYSVSTNEWTWVRGSNLPNQNGVYGTKGVASTTNNPGAREFMNSWTDASGNFWMFGGEGFPASGGIGGLNDLWRYNPITNEWTWMNGANVIDDPGTYGTKGVPAATNTPGARHGSGATTDASGNLWLFGGYGNAASTVAGNLNDLWRYSITSNQWTWMSGNNITNQYGNYGTLSVASVTNNPGAREFPACIADNNNSIWVYGGGGFAQSPPQGHLGDLWKYSISGNTWTWIKGNNGVNQQGIFGVQNTPAPNNIPGSRFAAAIWKDLTGNLWLFGGTGYAVAATPGRLNDLFMYNVTTNEWSWEHGNQITNSNGIYGIQTVSAPFNMPGARYYNTWWKESNGNFWMFGALGFCATGFAPNNMNDLWKFTPSCSPVNLTTSSALSICNGNSATLTAASSATGAINWFASSTSTNSLGSGSVFVTPTLTTTGGPSYFTYYAKAPGCPIRTPVNITVNATPTISIFSDNPLVCIGTTLNLSASGASTYTWNTSATGSLITISPSVTTTYSITGEDVNGCKSTAVITQSVSLCTGLSGLPDVEWVYTVIPNPNSGNFIIQSGMDNVTFYLYDLTGRLIFQKQTDSGETKISWQLSGGIYYYFLKEKDQIIRNGKMIIE